MSLRAGGWILVGVLAAAVGAIVGFSVADLTLPSDNDIDDAAHALVPPGWTVDRVEAGRFGPYLGSGPFDDRDAYRIAILASSPASPLPNRLAAAEASAMSEGWNEVDRRDWPGAVVINYVSGSLTADVHVRKVSGDLRISVEKDNDTVRLRRTIGAVIGGVLALGAVVAWRRRKAGTAAAT